MQWCSHFPPVSGITVSVFYVSQLYCLWYCLSHNWKRQTHKYRKISHTHITHTPNLNHTVTAKAKYTLSLRSTLIQSASVFAHDIQCYRYSLLYYEGKWSWYRICLPDTRYSDVQPCYQQSHTATHRSQPATFPAINIKSKHQAQRRWSSMGWSLIVAFM